MSQKAALKIAAHWMNVAQPNLKCDEFSLPYYIIFSQRINSLYNKLPSKVKKVMYGCNLHLCSQETLEECADREGILGLCRPKEKCIWYNIERFLDGKEVNFEKNRFDSLFYHEIGHYLTHFMTEREKSFYYKLFNMEPKTSGEPEADGFSAYMRGVAPYHVQEFWSWYILNEL